MNQDRQFGSWSLAAAAAAVLLVEGFYPIMVASIDLGDTAAWIAMLLAGLFALALFTPAALCLQRMDRGGLIALARAAAGWPGAVAAGILMAGLLVFHSGLVIRQTSEMAVGAVYPNTPQTFATTALVVCALYAAYGKLSGLVRSGRTFLPVLLLSFLFIVAGGIAWGRLAFLLPFWGPGPLPLVAGSLRLGALYVPVVLFLLVAAESVHDRQHIWRAGAVAIGGSSILFAVLKLLLLMAYPLPMGYSITYPLHELARLVTGGRFFERLEGAWVLVWVAGTAIHLAIILHTAAAAFAGAFAMPSLRVAVLPLVTISMIFAFFPPDQGQAIAWNHQAFPVYVVIGLLLPAALALLARFRRRAGHET